MVLGYLNPVALAGGSVPVRSDLAQAAVARVAGAVKACPAAMFTSLGRENGVRLVPVLLAGLDDVEQYFQPDRIHPNQQGQSVMLDNVWPELKAMLK